MKVRLYNKTAYPPRSPQLTFRYFVNNPNTEVISYYKQYGNTQITGIKENAYFDVIFDQGALYHGSSETYRKETQLLLRGGSTNDWSFKGISRTETELVNICIYENGVLVQGNPPPFFEDEDDLPPTPPVITESYQGYGIGGMSVPRADNIVDDRVRYAYIDTETGSVIPSVKEFMKTLPDTGAEITVIQYLNETEIGRKNIPVAKTVFTPFEMALYAELG